MSFRVVHQISSECDVFVTRASKNHVRIRIAESNTDNPTDFELEGDPKCILEALGTAVDVLDNLDAFAKEPS